MEDIYWLLFQYYKPISPKKLLRIINDLESLEKLFEFPETKAMKLGLTENEVSQISRLEYIMKYEASIIKFFEELLDEVESHNVSMIKIIDKNYPSSLKEIDDPPLVIFHKGSLSLEKLKHGLAIVGTRNASFFGRKTARELASYLASSYTIISGLARGIDTEAHCGALESANWGGTTLAVLAWMDPIYPGENEELVRDILKHGAIISEVFKKPNERDTNRDYIKSLFIKRDRIISALADALIVIETGEKGGTIHAVRFAKKYRKKIFVVEPPPEHFSEKRRSIEGYKLLRQKFNAIKIPSSVADAAKFILKSIKLL
ncbi:hypothetical protein DRJ17_05445 [Candidatus Woesearchaeota archaeon]|nr:MAG: hypothetical protein DRJ17_05445 [Candidatus Woesearchaeota archaeon]